MATGLFIWPRWLRPISPIVLLATGHHVTTPQPAPPVDGIPRVPTPDSCRQSNELTEYKPAEYQRTVEFLEYLKRQQPATVNGPDGFDISKGRLPVVDRVLSYVAPDGLTITDVNDRSTHPYTQATLGSALRRRRSRAFTSFVHLGYIYGAGHPQYSRLTYEPIPNGVVVCLAGWYHMTFLRYDSRLQLAKLDYVQDETE